MPCSIFGFPQHSAFGFGAGAQVLFIVGEPFVVAVPFIREIVRIAGHAVIHDLVGVGQKESVHGGKEVIGHHVRHDAEYQDGGKHDG